MPRIKEEEDLSKHTMWLRRGDVDFLREHFPQKASKIMRRLISNFVDTTRKEMAEHSASVKPEDGQ